MILLNNADSLIRRYSETACRIHTMLSQLNTSSNQRGCNMYCISYIKSMLLKLQCNNAFQSNKEQPLIMLPTGVFIDSTAALMGFRRFNFLFAKIATCDLVATATCDLVANATCDQAFATYEGGRAIEVPGASTFLPLMKSFQVW